MKYEQINLIFLRFCDSDFSHPGSARNPLARSWILQDLKLLVLENTDNSKPRNSLVINDDPSRLQRDELQS